MLINKDICPNRNYTKYDISQILQKTRNIILVIPRH
jgi:hypothetical protein